MDKNDLEEILLTQKRSLEAAARRKGERPRDRKPRQQLLYEHSMRLMNAKMMSAQLGDGSLSALRTTMVPPPYDPCILPYAALRKVTVRELRLETHHRGNYLLLRTLLPPWTIAGIGTVVEDERGDAMQLQLYHQLRPHAPQETDEMLIPQGCVLVVKEPFFKVTGDGGYGIRVDHVGDVVWLAADDERIPNAWRTGAALHDKGPGFWKKEGNAAFKAGNHREAVTRYTIALKQNKDEAEAQTLRLNRAMAFLHLECYDAALADATSACDGPKPPEKALYRAAMALYHLGRFDECSLRRAQLLREYPDSETGEAQMQCVRQRLREQATGGYDFRKMYDDVEAGKRLLDIATYVGPVEVKTSPGRGRGLFTTRHVKAGELLLCEKAFAYCGADDPGTSPGKSTKFSASSASGVGILISPHYNLMTMGTQGQVMTTVIQKTFRNPSLRPTFASLFSGSYKSTDAPMLVDGQPVIDSFLAERIVSLNAFGPPSSNYAYVFKRQGQADDGKVTSTGSRDFEGSDIANVLFHSSGVWLLASHINHSCRENAKRSFIGDALILRAAQDLAAGEELMLAYKCASDDDDQRAALNKQLREQWGFECRCAICAEARATPAATGRKRRALLSDVRATVSAVMVSVDKDAGNDVEGGGSGSGSRDSGAAIRQHIWLGLLAKAEQATKTLALTYKPATVAASGSRAAKQTSGRGADGAAANDTLPAPRLHLAMALSQLSMAWRRIATVTPLTPDRQAYAAKAVSAALEALRALGFVIRGGDFPPTTGKRGGSSSSGGGGGGKNKTDVGQKASSGQEQSVANGATATPTAYEGGGADAVADASPPSHTEPALVVEKWGYLQLDAFRIWEQLARAYELAGAPAALVRAAVEILRTAYRIEIGEDEATFGTVFPQWARTV